MGWVRIRIRSSVTRAEAGLGEDLDPLSGLVVPACRQHTRGTTRPPPTSSVAPAPPPPPPPSRTGSSRASWMAGLLWLQDGLVCKLYTLNIIQLDPGSYWCVSCGPIKNSSSAVSVNTNNLMTTRVVLTNYLMCEVN